MDPLNFLELLTKAGPFALFFLMFYIWYLERRERLDTQKSFRTLTELGFNAMKGTEDVLRELRFAIERVRGRDAG